MREIVQTMEIQNLSPGAILVGLIGFGLLSAGVLLDLLLLPRLRRLPPHSPPLVRRLVARAWPPVQAAILVVLLCGGQLLVLIMAGLAGKAGPAGDNGNGLAWLLLQALLFHGVGLLFIQRVMRRRGLSWSGSFGVRRPLGKKAITGLVLYVAAIPVVVAYSWAYRYALLTGGYEIRPQELILILAGSKRPDLLLGCIVFLAIAVAPVAEELLFRGIALPFLLKRMRVFPAVCLVSLSFAVLHFHVPSLVALFTIGTAFSLAYLYTGSIVVPIVMHATFNAVSILAVLAVPAESLQLGCGLL